MPARLLSGLTLLLPLFLLSPARGAASGFFLEVQIANPAGGSAALFYDVGQWYNQRDSSRLSVPAGPDLHTYRFAIAPAPIRRLRFDLTDKAGPVRIGRFRLTDDKGNVLDEFGPDCAVPMHDIKGYAVSHGVALVTAGSDNPMLLVDRPLQARTAAALGLHIIGAPGIMALSLGVAAAMLFAVAAALQSLPRRRLSRMLFLGSALVVFGARLAWLNAYSRPMPFWDEWEMDGADLLMPLRGHFLNWGSLFVPQSEHRTLVSRLVVLSGSILNGEWDPRVSMVAGAAMYAVSIGLICAVAAGLRLRLAIVGTVLVAALAAFPVDARNLFCGDQCQMYALNMMAVVVLCLAVARPSKLVAAAAGLASAISIFTMASGFVAPLLAAGMAYAQAARVPQDRPARITLGTLFLFAGLAGLALYRVAPFQGPSYAHSLRDFSGALEARLSWPLTPGAGHLLLVWFPWLAFVASLFLRKRRLGPLDGFLAALGAWVIVNAAGLAHGRPIDPFPFDNKYYTSMLLVSACAVLSLLQLFEDRATAAAAVATALSIPAACALYALVAASPGVARSYWGQMCSYDNVVRPYLRTGNRQLLYDVSPGILPYWNGAELAAQLDSPLMQPWLPAVLRQCLAQRPGSSIHGEQFAGPVTLDCRTAMKMGPYLAAIGALLIAAAAWGARRRASPPLASQAAPG